MRRQLRANGGITNLRQGYGLGDFVRKLIPNELADLASKAAPFVAPFNPLAAGIMRGVGRYDKRGSLKDALKQGVLTYAGGQGARMLGGAELQGLQNPFSREAFKSPIGADSPLRNIGRDFMEGMDGSKETSKKVIDSKRKTIDILKDKKLSPMAKVGEVYGGLNPVVKGQLITGGGTFIATLVSEALKDEPEQQPGETIEEYNARRKQKVSSYLRTYLSNTRPTASPKQIDDLVERYTSEYNQGGRVGYAMGKGPVLPSDEDPINPFGPKPIGPVLPNKMADARNQLLMKRIEELMDEGLDYGAARAQAEREMSSKNMGGIMRTGLAIGSPDKQLEAGAPPIMYSGNMDPNQKTGLPSIPGPIQMAEDGPEFDMRENGGFQPLGRQEGKDDVPAMLAKNEFVMTADAVRAAGGGSIEKGAQKMYDTMKKLESRVS
jgi:hypothetical protein